MCLFAAASGAALGWTKKQKPRGSSYKLEAGKRPPPPDSDSDDEKPAAAVSRALEKLDDEEEGPPPYDFTPDKAKPEAPVLGRGRRALAGGRRRRRRRGGGRQRVQGGRRGPGLRLGLGPGQPHTLAHAPMKKPPPKKPSFELVPGRYSRVKRRAPPARTGSSDARPAAPSPPSPPS